MGFGDMKDMFSQMRQAQKHIKEMQKKLSSMRVSADTGGGMVKATVDGEANLISLEIDNDLLTPDELKVLPKLITKAVQEAQKKAKDQVKDQVAGLAGGLNIPGL